MSDPVNLKAALGNVEALEELSLPDQQPNIEAQTAAISYMIDVDTNFEDSFGFVSGMARFTEEASIQVALNEVLEEGKRHAAMLYTWRCCSRAIPQPKSNEQPNRVEIYQKTVEVLLPEVKKLLVFMYFKETAIERFKGEVRRLSHADKRKDTLSEDYLLLLGELINMFAVLDELKNMKASLKNDYSTYRRSAQFLKVFPDSKTIQESQNLSMFLATQNSIRDSVRQAVCNFDNYESLLADIINTCVHKYENKMYLSPSRKYMLVKVMGFALFLMDGDQCNINKMDGKKRLCLAKIDKIFAELNVVPLYGDMQITPFNYVRCTPNYEPGRWPLAGAKDQLDATSVDLMAVMPAIRQQHGSLLLQIGSFSNELTTTCRDTPRTDAENRHVYQLALLALQRLCSWTSTITELNSWKLLHPTDHHRNNECPPDAEEYERATRYNYSDDEKSALVELVAMIKGAQALLGRHEATLKEAIAGHTYAELQDLVQLDLREPLRKAVKNKKDIVRTVLSAIRETAADWANGSPPEEDSLPKVKKFAESVKPPRRRVGPSSTQLYLVRTMLEWLLSDRCAESRTVKKLIVGPQLAHFEQFHRDSFFWAQLLNFSRTLEQCCDLSQLWYREFYLEMTMGKRIQFPIDMSLPWILIDHALASNNPALLESVLLPLDLYNDAGRCALKSLGSQYLYDEVEAEVNLVFDQFIYRVNERVFQYFKVLAGSMLLDRRFRAQCAMLGTHLPHPVPIRYATVLCQRHVQLLGRSIDFNQLMSQRINTSMRKSLAVALDRFESSDLTSIMEFQKLLELTQLCHELLSEHLTLDEYAAMFREVNHNVLSPYGRITLHVLCELNYDFLPNYCFNSSTTRFVRAVGKVFSPEVKRNKAPQVPHYMLWGSRPLNIAFSFINDLYSGFIGTPHFRAIFQLLGYQNVAVVIEELLKIAKTLIQSNIQQYAQSLVQLLPQRCNMASSDMTSPSVLEYYNSMMHSVTHYNDVRTEMFHCFREVGNILIFCLLLEQALTQEEVRDLLHAAPLQAVFPRNYGDTNNGKGDAKRNAIQEQFLALKVVDNIARFGTPSQASIAKEGDLLTRERLCCGLSIFGVVLSRLRGFLDHPIWSGPPPKNGVMNVEEMCEFHRLWSALMFVMCLPTSDKDFSPEQLFGDGLNWAGCAMLVMLGQQRRFDALDYCYHLLRVHRKDQMDGNVAGMSVKHMAQRVRRFQVLNSQIFAVINRYLHGDGAGEQDDVPVEHVKCFQPPVHVASQSAVTHYQQPVPQPAAAPHASATGGSTLQRRGFGRS